MTPAARAGVTYNPLMDLWRVAEETDVNYMVTAVNGARVLKPPHTDHTSAYIFKKQRPPFERARAASFHRAPGEAPSAPTYDPSR
ncbi:MAG: hypothetical protein R3C42_04455 [Parvularculaceae bacterium]